MEKKSRPRLFLGGCLHVIPANESPEITNIKLPLKICRSIFNFIPSKQQSFVGICRIGKMGRMGGILLYNPSHQSHDKTNSGQLQNPLPHARCPTLLDARACTGHQFAIPDSGNGVNR